MSKPVEPVGQTVIVLSRPYQLADGTVIEQLKVREPEVRDFRIANQQGKDGVDREVIVAARCCGLVLEDMDVLKWKDYQKVQRFLFGEDNTDGDVE